MSGSRASVLFVSKWMDVGGAERFVSTALHHLDRARFEPRLCLFRRILGYPIPEDVPVSVLSEQLEHRDWHLPPMVLRLARQLDRERPDVVFSAYSYPSFVVGAALRIAGHRPRWIARVGSNPVWHESGSRRWWMRWLYRRADLVLVNSQGLIETFCRLYPFAEGRVHHQPNPTDFARLEDLAGEALERGPRARHNVVAVGRLSAEKRVDLLIEAVARLAPELDVELVLVGDGPLRGELEARARECGVAERVVFAGFCRNPFQWMAGADLFAFSSDWEGSPNALIEAQGLGLAAVATDCDFGPAEILEPGQTGLLVPRGDAAALAEAMRALLTDPERRRRMGEAARQRARALFSVDSACESLRRRLEEVLA